MTNIFANFTGMRFKGDTGIFKATSEDDISILGKNGIRTEAKTGDIIEIDGSDLQFDINELQDIKQDKIIVTTIGDSGPATLVDNILNIPVYDDGLGGDGVTSIIPGEGIVVDASIIQNPVVSIDEDIILGAELGESAIQPGDDISHLTNDAGYIEADNNLSDLSDKAIARANLEVYSQTQTNTLLSAKANVLNIPQNSVPYRSAAGTGVVDSSIDLTNTAVDNTVPLRGTGGVLVVGIPTANTHATNKLYVDGLITSLQGNLGDLALKDKVSISDMDMVGTPGFNTYLRGDGVWSTLPPTGGIWGSIIGDINDQTDLINVLSDKVDKINSPFMIYATNSGGLQSSIGWSQDNTENTAAIRKEGGSLSIGEPILSSDATTKQYVDNGLSNKLSAGDVSTVAISGYYEDLENKPTIPSAQVPSDWNAVIGVTRILNKPDVLNTEKIRGVPINATTPTEGKIYVYRSGEFVLEDKPFSTGAPVWGDITGILSGQTDLNNELNNRVSKSTSNKVVYGTDNTGSQVLIGYDTSTGDNTIAQRGISGVLSVGDPTSNDHATTKQYVDTGLSGKANSVHMHNIIDVAGLGTSLSQKADLDVNGKLLISQLPAGYGEDIETYNSLGDFPAIGQSNQLYIAQDTNLAYVWTGSTYAPISSSLALGETNTTAYRGDRGKISYDHTLLTNNPHNTTKIQIGLGNVDNTSDIDKPVSTAQATALSNKSDVGHTHTASQITDFPTSMPPTVHNHDDRYYTETEIDNNVVKLTGNQTIDGIKVLSQGLTTMSTPGGINMKIASRYVNSGFAHGSQGHIMQVLWGDSVSSPEGTGNDGGWGLEFGSHGNYYMNMMGTGMEIGRTDGGVKLRGAVSVTNVPTSGSHVANKTYVDLVDSGRYNLGTSGTGKTIDWNNGRIQYMSMTGNCTIIFSNPVAGRTYVLELTQDATGSRTITRPSPVKTPGGAGIVLSTTANAKDVVTLYYDGTNYLTHIAKAYA